MWCRGLNTYERDGDALVTPARRMFGDGTPIQHRVGHQIRFAVSGFSRALQRVLTLTRGRLGGASFIKTWAGESAGNWVGGSQKSGSWLSCKAERGLTRPCPVCYDLLVLQAKHCAGPNTIEQRGLAPPGLLRPPPGLGGGLGQRTGTEQDMKKSLVHRIAQSSPEKKKEKNHEPSPAQPASLGRSSVAVIKPTRLRASTRPRPPNCATSTSPAMSSSPRRSLFGSLRDRLTRKPKSQPPSPNPQSNNPFFTAQGPPAAAAPASDTKGPPPYSEVAPTISVHGPGPVRAPSPAPSGWSARSDPNITSAEDPYAFLSSFDTIFLVDDSGSMRGRSWSEVSQALRAIAPICTAHDVNGIDVYFLNSRDGADNPEGGHANIQRPDQVERLFSRVRPHGATPTGTRINQILKPYLRHYESQIGRTGNPDDCGVKPVNMIVITDGVPTDDPESVIISIARKLDKLEAPPHQVGIQFFQVGNEPGAAAALRELDDGLAAQGGGVRDMVDTVTWDASDAPQRQLTADAILKIVLGAVVKRLDRRQLGVGSRASRTHLAP
ncbi:hypothetical protein BT67DRAFT_445815 [Trichocladium antarcticum]|uniref:VWFA domain-containing protein n=1 Tax=Trichocladium antarcticum TaxID=1450529 RepID=A0AAN6ZAI6_9PEZI|nr:hypothetical protein BT67DRAFT_445815 [Trichocladium antarcticum]